MRADNFANRESLKPRYVIRVSFDNSDTDLVYFTSHSDTETPPGATVISNVVRGISGISQKIDPEKGISTIGSFSFKIIDPGFVITSSVKAKLDAGYGLRFKKVVVYKGLKYDPWEKYEIVLTPIIDGVSCLDDVYTFRCADTNRIVRKDVFEPETTTISKTISATDGHIPVNLSDLTKFPTVLHDLIYSDRPGVSVGYIRLEDEIIAHAGVITHAVDGPSFEVYADHTGTHTGANNSPSLTDGTKSWAVNELVGVLIGNITDGSEGVITANTATTVTVTLAGGTDNDFDTGDSYKIYTGRGALNTIPAVHTFDAGKSSDRQLRVTEHIYLAGPALKLAYQVLTGHVAENLVAYSEDLTNAVWTDPSAEWTVTADTDIAPNGATTADEITVTAAGNALIRVVPSPSIAGGDTYTLSFWARIKSGTADSIDCDFGDGAVTSLNISSEWTRVYFTGASHATNNYVDMNIINASTGAKLNIWGVQLSKTNAMVPYVKTVATAQAKEILPDNWNLGVSPNLIAIEDFTKHPDLWNQFDDSGRSNRFEGMKRTDGKKFIESEIMFWLWAFMIIYSDGRLGFKRLNPVLSDSAYVKVLDKTNIVSYGELVHDYRNVINYITVKWNFVFSKDDYTKTLILIDTDSIAKHNQGIDRVIKLRGVHTSNHTDEDLISYFDSMRDRYSGPPLRLSLSVLTTVAGLEVGDVVLVELDVINDFNSSSSTLSRTFEIQQIQTDWITGDINLSLFGSSQKAGAISPTTLSYVLDDTLYESEGTELSTVLTISSNQVTANGSLPAGIYYYLGNLTVNNGVTITTSGTVQFRIRGEFTINGKIDSSGNGLTGGVGGTAYAAGGTSRPYVQSIPTDYFDDNSTDGLPGFLGTTLAPGSVLLRYQTNQPYIASSWWPTTPQPVEGVYTSAPYLNIKNNNTSLDGIPLELSGTSGSGARSINSRDTDVILNGYQLEFAGGNGGNSGGGIVIIARGVTFGLTGQIDTSGDDGAAGGAGVPTWVNPTNPANPRLFQAGYGSGGAPGALYILLDGNHTPPDVLDHHVALHGQSYIDPGLNVSTDQYQRQYPYLLPIQGFNVGRSAYQIQYIPQYVVPEEEI